MQNKPNKNQSEDHATNELYYITTDPFSTVHLSKISTITWQNLFQKIYVIYAYAQLYSQSGTRDLCVCELTRNRTTLYVYHSCVSGDIWASCDCVRM